ncbi:hypothetical protein Btru_059804 [Bulinus truncatus]|nr:hypothetical protein Btru_059804 [Bulinus truncatus]
MLVCLTAPLALHRTYVGMSDCPTSFTQDVCCDGLNTDWPDGANSKVFPPIVGPCGDRIGTFRKWKVEMVSVGAAAYTPSQRSRDVSSVIQDHLRFNHANHSRSFQVNHAANPSIFKVSNYTPTPLSLSTRGPWCNDQGGTTEQEGNMRPRYSNHASSGIGKFKGQKPSDVFLYYDIDNLGLESKHVIPHSNPPHPVAAHFMSLFCLQHTHAHNMSGVPLWVRQTCHPCRTVTQNGSNSGLLLNTSFTAINAQLSPASQLPKVADDQLKLLEENFQNNRNPSDLNITLIAAEVGLSESAVKRWFEHRLARWRQQQGLPANSGSVCG